MPERVVLDEELRRERRADARRGTDSGSDDRLFMAMGIVRGTMIVATIAWALGEALMRRSSSSDRLARAIWTIGIALALTHVVLAFQLVYGWNHESAIAATVKQAVDRFGWGWRGGIYINYAFLALWIGDVCWWWLAPRSHSTRSRRIEVTRFALFTFMFLNGAVVFAAGVGRLVGIASVAIAILGKLPYGRHVANPMSAPSAAP